MSDVCLLLEGAYPGGGGVVTWVDSLVGRLPMLSFSVVAFKHPRCGAPPSESVPPANVEEIVDVLLPGDGDPAMLPETEVDMLAGAVPEASVHHVLSVGVASRVAARAARNQNRPLLLTEHGIAWREKALGQHHSHPPQVRARQAAAARRAAVHAYSHADVVTSVSRTGADWQLRLGAPPSRVLHIANPAPEPRPPSGPVPAYDGAGPLVGLVARVVALKDVATFVRAAALVHAQLPTAHFVVLGATHEDEGYVERCLDLVHALGLDGHVDLVGDTDAWAWYPLLDVVVLTSRSEAQPFVVLEALAAGRPVVSTAAGDVPSMLAGAGAAGAVVPIGDAHAVAVGVLRSLGTDPGDVTRAARRVVGALPTEAGHALSYARLYDWAATARGGTRPAECLPAPGLGGGP